MIHRHTPESKAKIGNASRGNKYALGRKQSEEEKRKRSLALKKHYALKGHYGNHTPEGNKKISATVKNLWQDPEYRKHMQEAHKGHKHSEEQKHKIRVSTQAFFDDPKNKEAKNKITQSLHRRYLNPEARLKVSEWSKGNTYNIGRKPSLETRAKRSIRFSGSGNPSWLGGTSKYPYDWKFNNKLKNYIRYRDAYICQLCGISENGHRHCSHHFLYNKSSNPNDLILLCKSCNAKVNFNREYWISIFTTIMSLKRGLT